MYNMHVHPMIQQNERLSHFLRSAFGISLFDETFGPDYEYSKTVTVSVSFGNKPKFTFTGTDTMTLRAYATMSISANLNFEFEWIILDGEIRMEVTVVFDYGLSAGFSAEFVGQVIDRMEQMESIKYWTSTS